MLRSPQTLHIEALIKSGQSLSSIAREMGLTRGRVQQINRRMLTTSTPIYPQVTETKLLAQVVEVANLEKREKTPVWVNNSKQLMLRCIPPTHMRRFKVAQMFWVDGMSVLDIAVALDITEISVKLILHRLRKLA